MFYPFNVKLNKCSGNCNNINDPYARLRVPNVVKNMNSKVCNLVSRSNQTKQIKWHENCKCKCRLNLIVCNSKQKSNKNKCKCECKELLKDKSVIKDLFGILVFAIVHVINHVI